MSTTQRKAELVKRVAAMAGHRQVAHEAQEKLVERAKAQLDTMGPAIHVAEQHVEAGGDILAQRYLRQLLAERQKLIEVIRDHEEHKRFRAADFES